MTAPSAAESSEVPSTAARRRAQRVGTTVHALLEAIEWWPPVDPTREARAAALLPAELVPSLPEARAQVASTFEAEAGQALYSEAATRERLSALAEQPITRIEVACELTYGWVPADGESEPRAGIIDRLHLAFGSDADGVETVVAAEVIDAKTTSLTGAELETSLRESYAAQLAAYAEAVRHLYDLPPERIATKLLAVPAGVVVEIEN